jgi:hypothetical protein
MQVAVLSGIVLGPTAGGAQAAYADVQARTRRPVRLRQAVDFIIHIDDQVGIYGGNRRSRGHPQRNRSDPVTVRTSRTLAATLHRPAFLSTPAFALKLVFGEGALMMIQDRSRGPDAQVGYTFKYPHIDAAMKRGNSSALICTNGPYCGVLSRTSIVDHRCIDLVIRAGISRPLSKAERGAVLPPSVRGGSTDIPKARGFIHMTKFKVGDHVRWNSEAGHVIGRIVKVHTKDTDYKGYTHHASTDDPQYEIKSDRSDHVAMHKGTALHRID